jgi:hypothetical protein
MRLVVRVRKKESPPAKKIASPTDQEIQENKQDIKARLQEELSKPKLDAIKVPTPTIASRDASTPTVQPSPLSLEADDIVDECFDHSWSTAPVSEDETITNGDLNDNTTRTRRLSKDYRLVKYLQGLFYQADGTTKSTSATGQPTGEGSRSDKAIKKAGKGTGGEKRRHERKRSEYDGNEETEDDGSDDRNPKRSKSTEDEISGRKFLCPYYLRDPQKKPRSKQCFTGVDNISRLKWVYLYRLLHLRLTPVGAIYTGFMAFGINANAVDNVFKLLKI